jgi:hypothetical protein
MRNQGTGQTGGAERRARPRIPVVGSAEVKTRLGTLVGEAVDVSAAGVCLTIPQPLLAGELCSLELRIENEPPIETSIVGRVCFCIEQRAGYRIGVNCPMSDSLDQLSPR